MGNGNAYATVEAHYRDVTQPSLSEDPDADQPYEIVYKEYGSNPVVEEYIGATLKFSRDGNDVIIVPAGEEWEESSRRECHF